MLSNKIGKGYVLASMLISTAVVVIIFTIFILNSWNAFVNVGFGFFSDVWNPAEFKFGITSLLFGTFAVTLIALTIAVPLGVLTAIFTSEMIGENLRIYVKSTLELLAGIPSIIYGLIGIVFLSSIVENIFHLQTGRTVLTAGLLLSFMILPTIITLSDDALHAIPKSYRESANSLGLYKYEMIIYSLFPIAKKDIFGSILLALGRAAGETMAVMLVIGSIDKIPNPLYNILVPAQTITSKLGREISESAFGSTHFSALVFAGFVLLILVLVITLISQKLFNNDFRLHE